MPHGCWLKRAGLHRPGAVTTPEWLPPEGSANTGEPPEGSVNSSSCAGVGHAKREYTPGPTEVLITGRAVHARIVRMADNSRVDVLGARHKSVNFRPSGGNFRPSGGNFRPSGAHLVPRGPRRARARRGSPALVCSVYRGTSLKRNNPSLGPYSRFMPRALWWS